MAQCNIYKILRFGFETVGGIQGKQNMWFMVGNILLGILILLSHLGSPDTSILHPKYPVLLISMFSALILAARRSFSSLLPTPVLFVGGVCCWGPGLALGSMDLSHEILLCGSGQVLYSQANQGDLVTASPLHMHPWRLC